MVRDYDYTIFFIVLILVLFGVVMIFSSSYYKAGTMGAGDPLEFLKKQGLYALVGLAAMLAMSTVNYRYLKNLSWMLYFVSLVGLVSVLMFGEVVNGARRWLNIPPFGSVQPSEFAKLGIILTLATIISLDKKMFNSIMGFIKCGIIIMIPIALIAIGKNLSTVLIIVAISGAIIFVSSPYFWRYVFLVLAGVATLIGYFLSSSGYHSNRFEAWLDPFSDPMGTGYQAIQSMFAVASGGLFGLGLGQSRQKLGYIPEAYNDIIFAVICEELGFFGASFLLLLFCILIWRSIKVSMNAPDLFSCLIVLGITVQFAVQLIINVAVVTNTIPNTGIPMPFVSYGGTALLVNMFSMGVVLSVSRYSRIN